MIETLINLDKKLFLLLNGFHNSFFDELMYIFSAKLTWIPLYAVVVFVLFKKWKLKGFVPFLFFILMVVITDQVSVKCFKNVFHRLRPCHDPEIQTLVHIVKDSCVGLYGFVSSHAANTFGFAVFSALLFRLRWYVISILFWAAIVSYSRIYVGVHFPGDILGGALVGSLSALFVFFIYQKIALPIVARK